MTRNALKTPERVKTRHIDMEKERSPEKEWAEPVQMVFIKRLEIRGFKSVGKKVTLELERGFTAITGPNGSGKCLVEGTRVATSNGYRAVEELFEDSGRLGLTISSPDLQSYAVPVEPILVPSLNLARKRLELAEVVTIYKQMVDEETYRLETETGRLVKVTGEHKLLVKGYGWLRSWQLLAGMLVGAIEGGRVVWEAVDGIWRIGRSKQAVYDVCVPFYHNFIGGAGLVLHNSNVLDAVKFVLGEVSAKSLRTDKFSGVVCDSISGVGKTAFVRLLLDNSDRRIPVDEDEVTISREVDSSGESVYRLGKAQTQRAAISDLISVAGLSHRGYNMVMQGEIARIADRDPIERRQEIELAVGISEYDERKRQAMEQLREADTNIRVAAARMDEVSQRVEQLEEERNHALRSSFLQKEITKMRATMVSASLSKSTEEASIKRKLLSEKEASFVESKARHDEEQLQYNEKQEAWRRFTDEIEKGGSELTAIQSKAGEIQVKQAEASAKMAASVEAIERSRKELEGVKADLGRLHRKMRSERARMRVDASRHALLKSELSRERAALESSRAKLGKAERRREEALGVESEVAAEIAQRSQDLALLEGTLRSHRRRIQELGREMRNADERRNSLASTLRELGRHLDRLVELKKGERERLQGIEKNTKQKESLVGRISLEIDELTGLIERVRGALIQAETRKVIVQSIAEEERAVQKVIELKERGLIEGVVGKLSDLIEVEEGDRIAVEAASEGWLRSIVVDDLKAALICAEALKNERLGRIKLIPLSETVRTTLAIPEPLIGKVRGTVDIIGRGVEIEGAVCKVFGDTVIAKTRVDAIEASRSGLRAVTPDGEVFEPSGGIVGGYYRKPTEILSLLPPDQAVEKLETNLSKLMEFQEGRREEYAKRLQEELSDLARERVQTERGFELVEKEAKSIRAEVERISRSLHVTVGNIKAIRELSEETNENISVGVVNRGKLKWQIIDLRQKLRRARGVIRSLDLPTFEGDVGEGARRVSEGQEKLAAVRNRLSASSKNLKTILEPTAMRTKGEVGRLMDRNKALSHEIRRYEKVGGDLKALLEATAQKRGELSQQIEDAREKRRAFESEVQGLSKGLEEGNRLLEGQREELGKLRIEVERAELQEAERLNELKRLGYESPLQVEGEELSVTSTMLEDVEKEFQTIGPVNPLAIDQYGQQYKNYKMLSVRRNELEGERTGIVRFMDEIESKKRQTFMDALEKINASFGQFFEKITGGKGWLQLENVEDPFSGGLDMFVQFPSKSPRLVSAVSGGEKSVSAISFIFAMQELKPAPFYIMDEVDAHLDPMNAERFGELIRERSESSQMIAITLRDVVARKAHRIFGAYINKGVTQIVEMPRRKGET